MQGAVCRCPVRAEGSYIPKPCNFCGSMRATKNRKAYDIVVDGVVLETRTTPINACDCQGVVKDDRCQWCVMGKRHAPMEHEKAIAIREKNLMAAGVVNPRAGWESLVWSKE